MQRPCCRIVLGLTLLLGTLQAAAQDPRQEFEVVFWASSLSPATQASILSCPYNVSILGVGRDWPYNGIKLKLTFEYIREQKNEEKVVLFADSHDTLFQGGTLVCPSASTYADMYWSHEADVILQADGGCGWASARICGLYPHAEKPFLNSGVILSSVGALRTLLEEHYGEAEAKGEYFEHDQAFWHLIYGQQHKLLHKGLPLNTRIGVDYNETHVGTSLTHSINSVDEIFEHEGRLAYNGREDIHKLGCIIHAPGQTGSLIESGIMMKILDRYKSIFTASGRKRIDMYTNFATIHVH